MAAELARKILAGDIRSISRALSLVEDAPPSSAPDWLRELYPQSGESCVVGVTGSPGAGKSTLVDQLARHYLEQGLNVGIIAVDPSSPFSGGAILGDRVRMQTLATDPRIFIRSMATRGKLGGLCSAVTDALVILGAAGYDLLLVETVGVGQDEIDIVRTADLTLVLLVPGMGDDIQTIKAGIMEIGDLFVVNKADREGAARTRREVEAWLSLAPPRGDWTPAVVEAVAVRGEGVAEIVEVIEAFRRAPARTPGRTARRLLSHQSRLTDLLRDRLADEIVQEFSAGELRECAQEVMERRIDPYSVVDRWLVRFRERRCRASAGGAPAGPGAAGATRSVGTGEESR